MVYHGLSWSIMFYSDFSCSYHGLSWFFMILPLMELVIHWGIPNTWTIWSSKYEAVGAMGLLLVAPMRAVVALEVCLTG